MSSRFRKLALSERAFTGEFPTICSLEVHLRGRLDTRRLETAFTALRRLHPALAACIVDVDDDQYFSRADPGVSARVLIAPTAEPHQAAPIPPRLDIGRSLSAMAVETDGGRHHRVTLHVAHALGDGAYVTTMLADLFRIYRDAGRAGYDLVEPSVDDAAFPMSAHDVLLHSGTAAPAAEVSAAADRLVGTTWHGSAVPPIAQTSPRWPVVRSIRLDATTTSRLLAAIREARVSVFAAIAGAIVCAERIGFDAGTAPATTVDLGVMTMVDLRRRVVPVLDPAAVTNFVAPSFHAAHVRRDDDPVSVGEALVRSLTDDIAGGLLFQTVADAESGRSVRRAHDHPPVVVSNLGTIPDLALPPELTADDIRPTLWFDCTGLTHDGPDADRRPAPVATTYQVSTYAGRLGVEMITLPGTVGPTTRTAIGDTIETRLRGWADGAPVRARSTIRRDTALEVAHS